MENDRGRCATCEYNIAGRCDILGDGVKGNSRCSEYEKRESEKNGTVVYINLHPTSDYANAIVQKGYVAPLKEYVKAIEWLIWTRGRGKWMLMINGSRNGGTGHLERTNAVICRLLNEGATVFVRDDSSDEWREVVQLTMSVEEMYALETEECFDEKQRKNIGEIWTNS